MAAISAMNSESATVELIVAIHHGCKYKEPTFDGGLSLLNDLYNKLSMYYSLNWNVDDMKRQIRESNDCQEEYMNVLRSILTEEMMECYGL
jgi:hypothetical protein